MRKQLLGKFRAEKDKMPPEKRALVLTHFPRFLSLLEEEIYDNNSPIWDLDFRQAPPPHVQQMAAKSSDSSGADSGCGAGLSSSSAAAAKKRSSDDDDG